jgi:hypothetical protein
MSKKASQIPKLPVATDDEAKQDPGMHTQDQRLSVIEKSIDEIKTSNAQVQNSFAEILAKFDAQFADVKACIDSKISFTDSDLKALIRAESKKTLIDCKKEIFETSIAQRSDSLEDSDSHIAQVDVSTSLAGKSTVLNPSDDKTSIPFTSHPPTRPLSPSMFDLDPSNSRFRTPSNRSRIPEAENGHFQDTFRNSPSRVSAGNFYDKYLSRSSFMDTTTFSTGSNYVHTSHAVDPIKSGVLLSYLDVFNFFRWSQDLIALEKRNPHQHLQHCLFISRKIQFRINAWNESKKFFAQPIMCGSTLSVDNRALSIIIAHMVLPDTEHEWIQNFKTMAVFPKLPNNQHVVIPDATRFEDWHDAITIYIYDANVILDFLSSVPDTIMPVMKTFNQKKGLIELFYDQIPMGAGKNINNLIDYNEIKQCNTLRDYTNLFFEQTNIINEASKTAKINRQRLSNQNIISINNNNNENNKFNNNSNNINGNKYNNNNNNKINGNKNYNNDKNYSTSMVPYKNPYEKRLHRMQGDQVRENSFVDDHFNSCDVDNDEEYDEDLLQTSHDLHPDNDEFIHDERNTYSHDNFNNDNYTPYIASDSFEGSNPGINVTNNLSNINNPGAKQQTCFNKFLGRCTLSDKECRYSHAHKDLQREWWDRDKEQKSSFYNPANNKPPAASFNSPLSPHPPPTILKRHPASLRSIRPTEEVSYPLNNHRFQPPGENKGLPTQPKDV